MNTKEELEAVWGLLHRAMSVIEDMTNLRRVAPRLEQEIEDIQEEITELEGVQE